MKLRRIISFSALSVLLLTAAQAWAGSTKVYSIESPDNNMVAEFTTDNQQHLVYRLQFKNQAVLNWSRLGLSGNILNLTDDVTIKQKTSGSHKETFKWDLGENAEIENNYNTITLHCRAGANNFDLITRVYNGSLAFRYVYRCEGNNTPRIFHLNDEWTEFNLVTAAQIYQYHEESIFRPTLVNELTGASDLPSTLVSQNKFYISISEAENRNYTKCVLVKGKETNSLRTHFYVDTAYRNHVVSNIRRDTDMVFKDSVRTPWRTISCSETAIGLHNFSELNLKLTEPAGTVSTKGIHPGKAFRVPISTSGALAGIDFAQKMNFQYILIEAGWYGPEARTSSNPLKPIDGMDIQHIIDYGKTKNIGVILYVNYVGLRAKLDSILPLYKKWGVAGIKFGFVDGGNQRGLSWLDTAMMKVNNYGMILNVHDHYKPTGLSRRYPYNLSQEGIRGDENGPDAFHTTVLPYTRFLAGAADFTFCYPNSKNKFSRNLFVSKGQQLALTVIYFDPIQAIFWYGHSEDYSIDDEVEFFRQVPTVWDKSIYLAGEIGEYISVARKKNDVWFIGTAAGLTAIETSINLNFLDAGKNYKATIYEDNGSGGIEVKNLKLKKNDHLPIQLMAKGGQAIIIMQN